MSISRSVYLRRTNLPAPKAWANAIRAAGFPMGLDADFVIEEHSGFLPCTYDGKDAGFEYYFSTAEELRSESEDGALPDIGDRDVAISFVTHASIRELVTAVVAAAVLCQMADGIVHDEESGERIAAGDALADARELLASVGNDLD